MVIQRLQTLYLILAIICTIFFMFIPYGYINVQDELNQGIGISAVPLDAVHCLGLIILSVLSIVSMVVSILLFKNLTLQKRIVDLSAFLLIASIAVVVYAIVGKSDAEFGWGGILPVVSFVLLVGAHRGISSDQRLLRSYEHFH